MKKNECELKIYEDIIDLPHHVSCTRLKMTLENRAAQFAPFAAVVGHEAAVKEAARLTDSKKALDETEKAVIHEQLKEIENQFPNRFEVKITYFKADDLKTGGKYFVKVGKIKKLDLYLREIHMTDDTRISIDDIFSIL